MMNLTSVEFLIPSENLKQITNFVSCIDGLFQVGEWAGF